MRKTPVFESILTDLRQGESHLDLNESALDSCFVSHTPSLPFTPALSQAHVSSNTAKSYYASQDVPEVPDAAQLSTNDALIKHELDLRPGLSRNQVLARRRVFASRNHPDKADPEYRAIATQKMIIANVLCDDYGKNSRDR